jgi:hypothetical protein
MLFAMPNPWLTTIVACDEGRGLNRPRKSSWTFGFEQPARPSNPLVDPVALRLFESSDKVGDRLLLRIDGVHLLDAAWQLVNHRRPLALRQIELHAIEASDKLVDVLKVFGTCCRSERRDLSLQSIDPLSELLLLSSSEESVVVPICIHDASADHVIAFCGTGFVLSTQLIVRLALRKRSARNRPAIRRPH